MSTMTDLGKLLNSFLLTEWNSSAFDRKILTYVPEPGSLLLHFFTMHGWNTANFWQMHSNSPLDSVQFPLNGRHMSQFTGTRKACELTWPTIDGPYISFPSPKSWSARLKDSSCQILTWNLSFHLFTHRWLQTNCSEVFWFCLDPD